MWGFGKLILNSVILKHFSLLEPSYGFQVLLGLD